MGPVKYHQFSEKILYRDCFDKDVRYEYEQEWRFALIPDYEWAKSIAARDANAVYDENIIYNVGSLRDIAERIDKDTLLKNPGKLYTDKDVYRYKTVDKVSDKEIKVKIEKIMKAGFPVSYDAYPEQYVGWGTREEFRRNVLEIDGGQFKPIFVIG